MQLQPREAKQKVAELEQVLIYQLALLKASFKDLDNNSGENELSQFQLALNLYSPEDYQTISSSMFEEAKKLFDEIYYLYFLLKREVESPKIHCFKVAELGEKLAMAVDEWESWLPPIYAKNESSKKTLKDDEKHKKSFDEEALKRREAFKKSDIDKNKIPKKTGKLTKFDNDEDEMLKNLEWMAIAYDLAEGARSIFEPAAQILTAKKSASILEEPVKPRGWRDRFFGKKDSSILKVIKVMDDKLGLEREEVVIRQTAVISQLKQLEQSKDALEQFKLAAEEVFKSKVKQIESIDGEAVDSPKSFEKVKEIKSESLTEVLGVMSGDAPGSSKPLEDGIIADTVLDSGGSGDLSLVPISEARQSLELPQLITPSSPAGTGIFSSSSRGKADSENARNFTQASTNFKISQSMTNTIK